MVHVHFATKWHERTDPGMSKRVTAVNIRHTQNTSKFWAPATYRYYGVYSETFDGEGAVAETAESFSGVTASFGGQDDGWTVQKSSKDKKLARREQLAAQSNCAFKIASFRSPWDRTNELHFRTANEVTGTQAADVSAVLDAAFGSEFYWDHKNQRSVGAVSNACS